jgi:uncharacterized protein YkwD
VTALTFRAVRCRGLLHALFVFSLVLGLTFVHTRAANADTAGLLAEAGDGGEPIEPGMVADDGGTPTDLVVPDAPESDIALPDDQTGDSAEPLADDAGESDTLPASVGAQPAPAGQTNQPLIRGPVEVPRPSPLAFEMIDNVNGFRAKLGLSSLAVDGRLGALALERSTDMARRQYFSHTNPDGLNIFDLMAQRRLSYRIAAENLAFNSAGERETVGTAMQALLDSPAHRANMAHADLRQIGVGVASANGRTYFTLIFVG